MPDAFNARGWRPSFLLIGAAKAATSSLHVMLDRHPDVFMVQREQKYFSNPGDYPRGLMGYLDEYERQAATRGVDLRQAAAIGEGSNNYSMAERYPGTADRVAALLPEARIIYSVRDPIARIESFFLQRLSQGDETTHDIDEAVLTHPDIYISPSDYRHQISFYRRAFSDDRILVVFQEELLFDESRVTTSIFSFLGVDGSMSIQRPGTRINRSIGKKVDRRWVLSARKLGIYETARRMLPENFRKDFKQRFLQTAVKATPRLSTQARAAVLDRIGESSLEFLREMGRAPSLWDLSVAARAKT